MLQCVAANSLFEAQNLACCSVLQCVAANSLFETQNLDSENSLLRILREITAWRRVIGCLMITGHFPQKSPMISG